MSKFFQVCLLLSIYCVISGCAIDSKNSGWRNLGRTYQSEVKPQPDGTFYVEAEASLLAGRQAGAAEVANELASNHCALSQKKIVQVKQEADSNLVLNGVSRLSFKCQ